MTFISKAYRKMISINDKLRSALLICHYKIKYPSLKINFSSYLGRHVDIICCDGSVCEINNVFIAKNVYLKVESKAVLKISDCYIGANTMIVANEHIEIGSNCSIGEMVVIRDQDHVYGNNKLLLHSGYTTGKIIIHENVWLGAKSTILKGVELGDNTVVGAHSLVNKSFPANSIVAGVPAKPIVKK